MKLEANEHASLITAVDQLLLEAAYTKRLLTGSVPRSDYGFFHGGNDESRYLDSFILQHRIANLKFIADRLLVLATGGK